jgi:hypothetical protein
VQRIAINLQDQAVPEAPHEGFKTSEVAYHKSKTNGEYNQLNTDEWNQFEF